MIDYGRVRSTVKPDETELDEYSVYLNTNIAEITVESDGEAHLEYEFDQIRYSKDEFIMLQSEQIAAQDAQIVDTQLALCDVYEMLGG